MKMVYFAVTRTVAIGSYAFRAILGPSRA